jgi:hypothetical protein
MTFTDLCAAMWDGRQVNLTGDYGRNVTAVPTGIARHPNGLWEVLFDSPYGRDLIFVNLDSFDSHHIADPNKMVDR